MNIELTSSFPGGGVGGEQRVHAFGTGNSSSPTMTIPLASCQFDSVSSIGCNTSPSSSLTETSPPLQLVMHGDIWTPDVVQRIATLVPLMAVSFIGNAITVVVLTCSKYRKSNSRINIFIINLALGDLAVCCFTMTTEVLFVIFEKAWVLGAALCKILLYVQMVTLASTTFILTAMSVDRYRAICRPLSLGSTSGLTSRPKAMICVAWLGALVFATPQLFIFKQVTVGIYPEGDLKHKCLSRGYSAWWQRKTYFTFLTAYILVIPAFVICFCYINVVRVVWRQGKEVSHREGIALRKTVRNARFLVQAKINTIKVTLSIICAFIGCWTPYFVVHLIHIWSEYTFHFPESIYVFSETLALLNSALNPVLYGFFNVQLKRGLIEVCCPRRIRAINSTAGQNSGGGGQQQAGPGTYIRSNALVVGDSARRPSSTRRRQQFTGDSSIDHSSPATRMMCTLSTGTEDLQLQPPPSVIESTPRPVSDRIITEQNQPSFKLRVQFLGSTERSRCPPRRRYTATAATSVSLGAAGDPVANWVSMKHVSTSANDVRHNV